MLFVWIPQVAFFVLKKMQKYIHIFSHNKVDTAASGKYKDGSELFTMIS